ncbi:MAG: hypothetical protein LBJ95_02125 [Oscillospiraceae bacterium]|jgi:hypothetical protein|nr:hypothetical protein [Oscillospiraceae bacterium]
MKKLLSLVTAGLLASAAVTASVPAQALQILIKPADPDNLGSLPSSRVQTVNGELFGANNVSPTVITQVGHNIPVQFHINAQNAPGAPPHNQAIIITVTTGAVAPGTPIGAIPAWNKVECYKLGLNGGKEPAISTLLPSQQANKLPPINVPADCIGAEINFIPEGAAAPYVIVSLKW